MAFIRQYSRGSMGPGRTGMRGDPFLGALAGAALPALKKLAGKGLAKLTGGKLIGKGGATAAAKKVGGALIGVGGGFAAAREIQRGTGFGGFGGGGQRKYRRMNAGNAKALRRAFRRIDAFTKLASKAGYVRRKPFGSRRKAS